MDFASRAIGLPRCLFKDQTDCLVLVPCVLPWTIAFTGICSIQPTIHSRGEPCSLLLLLVWCHRELNLTAAMVYRDLLIIINLWVTASVGTTQSAIALIWIIGNLWSHGKLTMIRTSYFRTSHFKETRAFSFAQYKSQAFAKRYCQGLYTGKNSTVGRAWSTNFYLSGMANTTCLSFAFKDNLWHILRGWYVQHILRLCHAKVQNLLWSL